MLAEQESLFLQLFTVAGQDQRALARFAQQTAGRQHITFGPVVQGRRLWRIVTLQRVERHPGTAVASSVEWRKRRRQWIVLRVPATHKLRLGEVAQRAADQLRELRNVEQIIVV